MSVGDHTRYEVGIHCNSASSTFRVAIIAWLKKLICYLMLPSYILAASQPELYNVQDFQASIYSSFSGSAVQSSPGCRLKDLLRFRNP